MRTLIVEDDFVSRRLIQRFLEPFGECDVAVNGKEALEAYRSARQQNAPYHLVCLDIMMPELDGHEVLKQIRAFEREQGLCGQDGVKVIMTTVRKDPKSVMQAFSEQCEAYLVKPIDRQKLYANLEKLGLTSAAEPTQPRG